MIFESSWNSVSNIYYACLIRQIASNDEMDAFTWLSTTNNSDYVSNVCEDVLALLVRPFDIGYLKLKLE